MFKKIQILSFIMALLFANVSFAASFEFKDAPKVDEQTSEGIKVSWEKIDWALWYLVMYSKNPWKDGVYDNELEDLVETTWALVPVTEKWTYYVAVSAFDSEYNEVVSPELKVEYTWASSSSTWSVQTKTTSVSTQSESWSLAQEQKFTMENVEVVSDKELKVTFSSDVDSSKASSFEFMLTPKDNKNAEIKVENVSVWGNNNELSLKLASSMDVSTEYELVAISVSDSKGNTIESWVDWMVVFTSPSEFAPELNSAPEELTASWSTWSLATEVAPNAEALPTTWPKEALILILALMIWWLVFFAKRKLS